MASMQFCRPEEEVYYEEQYMSLAQPAPAYGAGYQMGDHGHNQGHLMGFRAKHRHNKGQHMGFRQHMPHSGQVHDQHMHMAGPGMLMQTPGYQMGNHYGSMEHHQQGHGYEVDPGHLGQVLGGHLGQVLGGHAKHQEQDGMAYYGKGEKKMKDKKNKKKGKKNKKDDSSSDSD